MANKLIIVMANSDPTHADELGPPLFQAALAAAMEYEVEVIVTGAAGKLMFKGIADKMHIREGSPKTVYDYIKDAHEVGAQFYCCSPSLEALNLTEEDLIPECTKVVGGLYLVQEVMGDHVRVLTY